MCDGCAWHIQTDFFHRHFEFFAVFGHVDGFFIRTDHLHAEFFQHAFAIQIQRTVERGLTAHGRQQHIGLFFFDDGSDSFPGDRLDVSRVRRFRVGHDGRRIRVHQDNADALFTQRLTRLCAGIVKLTSLTDDDGAGTDDQYTVYVLSFRHQCFLS